ncbi:MAG TPA: hypothetical protein VH143_34130 [Kofleriaceae bacterium]|jgi:hypothetical protein|nr:hypothetical protein [Kofleriaceae bacterium]
MRNTSLWIAALAVALACGCKSKESTETKQEEPKPAGTTVSADQVGTFTCKTIENEGAAGSNSPCVDVTDHFDAAVPVVHVTYRTVDLPKSGDAYVIQWIATDVGQAAPANTVIATVNKTVEELPAATNSYTLNGYLTKPTNGWPIGKYRVEIKLGDKLVTTAQFAIR